MRKKHFMIVLFAFMLVLIPDRKGYGYTVPRTEYVFVCTGPYAKVWHSSKKCSGLNRCSGEIKRMTKTVAKKNGYERPCKKCY